MFEEYQNIIEEKIKSFSSFENCEFSHLLGAMNYSLSAGGKRIRPKLMMEFTRVCGKAPSVALNFAVALEMIHTYSLIHDDLPCMDNDDMRRGRPSCHKAFDEATALLAGDALLTDAFKLALSTENVPYENIVNAAAVLSECAGSHGMIGGQVIDLKYEASVAPLNVITELYRLKTGCLLKAAATIGCILADAEKEKINAASKFAENIGIAFQIRDDILDIIGSAEELGKPIGSDKNEQKSTYVSIVGLEEAQRQVNEYTDAALSELEIFGNEAENLKAFALSLIYRKL